MKKIVILLIFCLVQIITQAQTTPAYVPTNGLVGYWPFNGNANDESANGNNGTVNGATLTSDRNGNANSAYYFAGNGSNNKITVSNPFNLPIGNQSITISIWSRTNSTYWGRFLIVYGGSNWVSIGTGTNGGGNINYAGGLGVGTYPVQTIFANQWVQTIITFNASTQISKFYSDGQLISTSTNISLNTNIGALIFGSKSSTFVTNPGDDYIWLGELDDIGIWNRALTQQEVTALYTSTPTPTCTFSSNHFAQDTIAACGSSYTLTAGAGFSNYNWSTADTTSSITVNNSGWYQCTVTNSAGCKASDSVYVSLVNANILQNDTTICAGNTVQLNWGGSTINNVTDTMQLYNNFIFTALDTIAGIYKIWKKQSYNSNYISLFDDQYHRIHPILSSNKAQIVYVRYKRGILMPNSTPMQTSTMDSAWVCLSAINGSNEQILFLVPDFNRDAIYSLDWSSDGKKILFVKANDTYPNISRDGDVFEYDLINNSIINITNNWDIMDARAKYIPGTYDFVYTKLGSGWLGYTVFAYKYIRSTNSESLVIGGAGYAYDNTVLLLSGISLDGQNVHYRRRGNKYFYQMNLSNNIETLILNTDGLGGGRINNMYYDVSNPNNLIRLSLGGNIIYTFQISQIRDFIHDGYYVSHNDAFSLSDICWLGKWDISYGNIIWSTGDTTATINVTPTQTTTYYCTVNNGISSCTDSVTVTVNPLPTNIFAQDTIAACGSIYSLSAGAGFSNYNWSTGDTTQTITVNNSGWYQCAVTNSAGCTATDSVFVSLVNATILQNDTTICAGSNLLLAVSTTTTSSLSSSVLPTNLQQGLIGYWPFNGNANDESGNGNNGTVNGATLTNDRFGNANKAYSFDGVNNSIIINNNLLGSTNSSYSVDMWIQIDSFPNASNFELINNRSGSSCSYNYRLYINSNGKLYFQKFTEIPWTVESIVSNSSINLTTWNHVVLVYNHINNSMSMYLNNTFEGSVNSSIWNGLNNPTNIGYLSGCNVPNQNFHLGKLDDIAIYNRVLTPQEITQLYNVGNQSSTCLWSTGDTTASINVNPTQTTTYYCTVSNGTSSCTDSVTVTVNPLPTNIFAQDTIAACGSSYALSAGAGYSNYNWSTGDTTASITVSNSGWYQFTVTNSAGCTASDTIYIAINTLPTVTANSTATTVCAGTSVTLTGGGATTYTWTGGVANGVSFVPTATTTYTVTGTNAAGCTNSATTTITVNALPTVTATSSATSVCAGNSVTLTGGGATNYTWSGGVTNGVSFIPTATTTYTVTGTNAAGCTKTSTKTITVNTLPTVTANANATIVCAGNSVTLTGGGASTYTWSGGVTNGVNFIPTATTTYTVTGTNAAGCSKTATKTITVNALPTVTSNLSAVTVCTGTSVTLNGGGATTYTWTGGVVNGVSFVPTATTTYTVTGTNAAGCTNSATTTITVNALPTVTANASATTICAGTSVTLTGGGVSTYTWSGGVTNGASFIPTATTTYTVTGTNAAGCSNTATKTITVNALPTVTANASATSVCAGTSVTLTGGGATTYTWSGGVTNGASFIPTATTTYTVTTSNATGCTNTATQLITVNALPTVTANATATNLCTGSSVTLTGGGASTYTWTGGVTNGVSFIPTVTTTYTVTGTDVNGCKNTASKTISMNILPTLVISASKKLYCQKDASGILTGNPVGGVWSGIGVSGNTFNPTVAGLGSFYAVYSFTATNGCTNKDSLLMTVSTCLGIAETTTANLFSVYPNPTTSEINVKTDAQLLGSEYIVYDNSGKIILKGKIKSANTLIKLSDFSAGVYFFTVVNQSYGKQTIKVIKE